MPPGPPHADRPPSLRSALSRGLRRRCPACGVGNLFHSFARLRHACPSCGWVLEREPGAVTGAMYLVAILTQGFAVVLLVASWLLPHWSPWTKMAVGLPLIALFSLFALPLCKGAWVAVDFVTDIGTGETLEADYARRAYENDESKVGSGEGESSRSETPGKATGSAGRAEQ